MKREAWYDAWRQRRGQEPAPPGFADRVMAAVAAEDTARQQRSLWSALLLTAWSTRWSRIGLCSLAAVACAFRLLHVVALFISQ